MSILKKLRASQLRCAPGYRHKEITVLITGNPNRRYHGCRLTTELGDVIVMPIYALEVSYILAGPEPISMSCQVLGLV